MMSGRHSTAANATVGSDGRAVITLGPGRANERWIVRGYSVTLSSGDGELRLYHGAESAGNFLEGTYDASQNASDRGNDPIELSSNEALTFVFSDATNGVTATARVRYDLP